MKKSEHENTKGRRHEVKIFTFFVLFEISCFRDYFFFL